MPLHKLPIIMAFNVEENVVFIHEFSNISLPREEGYTPAHTLPPLGRFDK